MCPLVRKGAACQTLSCYLLSDCRPPFTWTTRYSTVMLTSFLTRMSTCRRDGWGRGPIRNHTPSSCCRLDMDHVCVQVGYSLSNWVTEVTTVKDQVFYIYILIIVSAALTIWRSEGHWNSKMTSFVCSESTYLIKFKFAWFLRMLRCVVSCGSTSFPWLVLFFGALLWAILCYCTYSQVHFPSSLPASPLQHSL